MKKSSLAAIALALALLLAGCGSIHGPNPADGSVSATDTIYQTYLPVIRDSCITAQKSTVYSDPRFSSTAAGCLRDLDGDDRQELLITYPTDVKEENSSLIARLKLAVYTSTNGAPETISEPETVLKINERTAGFIEIIEREGKVLIAICRVTYTDLAISGDMFRYTIEYTMYRIEDGALKWDGNLRGGQSTELARMGPQSEDFVMNRSCDAVYDEGDIFEGITRIALICEFGFRNPSETEGTALEELLRLAEGGEAAEPASGPQEETGGDPAPSDAPTAQTDTELREAAWFIGQRRSAVRAYFGTEDNASVYLGSMYLVYHAYNIAFGFDAHDRDQPDPVITSVLLTYSDYPACSQLRTRMTFPALREALQPYGIVPDTPELFRSPEESRDLYATDFTLPGSDVTATYFWEDDPSTSLTYEVILRAPL